MIVFCLFQVLQRVASYDAKQVTSSQNDNTESSSPTTLKSPYNQKLGTSKDNISDNTIMSLSPKTKESDSSLFEELSMENSKSIVENTSNVKSFSDDANIRSFNDDDGDD